MQKSCRSPPTLAQWGSVACLPDVLPPLFYCMLRHQAQPHVGCSIPNSYHSQVSVRGEGLAAHLCKVLRAVQIHSASKHTAVFPQLSYYGLQFAQLCVGSAGSLLTSCRSFGMHAAVNSATPSLPPVWGGQMPPERWLPRSAAVVCKAFAPSAQLLVVPTCL